ncbi:MAG: nucleotidyl transferase AbiEii/AbiGii toxin family protein [Lacibacter sp.]
MLHYQTVAPATLDLLKLIAAEPAFSTHRLVGGTALALQYGHRLSVDLDFFSDNPMEHEEIVASIRSFSRLEITSRSKFINSFFINDIKVDFVSLPYAWLEAAAFEDEIGWQV